MATVTKKITIDIRAHSHDSGYLARTVWEALFRQVNGQDFTNLGDFLIDLKLFQNHIEERLCEMECCSTTFYWSHSAGQLTYFATRRDLLDDAHENLHKITVDAKNNLITIEWDEVEKLVMGRLIYQPVAGSVLPLAIEEAVEVSRRSNYPVDLTFNDTKVTIEPESTVNEVYKEWMDQRPNSRES